MERLKLEEEIAFLKKKIKALPFIDTIDLRYNNRIRIPAPSTQAVMFCIMDVSGSMDEAKKQWIQKAISKPGALKNALKRATASA
jgi:uncharacterized sporulation protein YeaH/YhbH (DUF444 family)